MLLISIPESPFLPAQYDGGVLPRRSSLVICCWLSLMQESALSQCDKKQNVVRLRQHLITSHFKTQTFSISFYISFEKLGLWVS